MKDKKEEWCTPEFWIMLPNNNYGIMTVSDNWETGEY